MKGLLLTTLALLALALAPAIHAQTDGAAYYGLALGDFEYIEGDEFGDLFSDSVSSWHLMISYMFMEHLGVEGSYGKTSTIRDSFTFLTTGPPGSVEVGFESEISMLTIRLVGVLPFDNGISLMAGLGYADVDQDIDLTLNGVPSQSVEISENNPAYYVGVQYDWDRIALRLAYEQYDFSGDTFQSDIDAAETTLTFFYKL
jgi:opacity protein-like surface antigen